MTVRAAVTDAVVVEVTGEDRLRHLEDVTTQHVVDLAAGAVSAALVLDANGAPLAAFDVLVASERVLLLAPSPAVAEHLVGTIGSRTFLADATYRATDERVVALRGDAAAIARLLDAALDAAGSVVPAGPAVLARPDGLDVVVGAAAATRLVDAVVAAGGGTLAPAELEDERVREGRPAFGAEVIAPHLPEESGLLATHVHLAKGCYPGQEAVARMWMLGRPRRRLARLVAREGTRLVAGAASGEGRGRIDVTSVTSDGGHALAYVPATTTVGEWLVLDGATAEVLGLVGDGLEVPGHDPRQRRRRDVERTVPPSAQGGPAVSPAGPGRRRP